MWSAGIKLWIHLHMANGASVAVANLAVFITTFVAVIMLGEVFYRTVDAPSQWLAAVGYHWITK